VNLRRARHCGEGRRWPSRTVGVRSTPVGFGRVPAAHTFALPASRTRSGSRCRSPSGTASRRPRSIARSWRTAPARRPNCSNGFSLGRSTARRASGRPTARIVAADSSDGGFWRRRIDYRGPVEVLCGRNDRLLPVAHAGGVRAALPQARITIRNRMATIPNASAPACSPACWSGRSRAPRKVDRGRRRGCEATDASRRHGGPTGDHLIAPGCGGRPHARRRAAGLGAPAPATRATTSGATGGMPMLVPPVRSTRPPGLRI
jgi:hypothetical protein